MTPLSSLPGIVFLLAVSFAAASGMAVTSREIEGIWNLRLEVLAAGMGSLGQSSAICQELKAQQQSKASSPIQCLRRVELRVGGLWRDSCETEAPTLNPPRYARLSTNCTWQIGPRILRLPAVEIILKR